MGSIPTFGSEKDRESAARDSGSGGAEDPYQNGRECVPERGARDGGRGVRGSKESVPERANRALFCALLGAFLHVLRSFSGRLGNGGGDFGL